MPHLNIERLKDLNIWRFKLKSFAGKVLRESEEGSSSSHQSSDLLGSRERTNNLTQKIKDKEQKAKTKFSFLPSNIFCSASDFEYPRISICLQLWDAQLLIKCLWVDICFWRRGGGRGSLTMQNPIGSHAHIFKSRRIVENRANNHIWIYPATALSVISK